MSKLRRLVESRPLLTAYTILLFLLCLFLVNDNSFWGDECYTIRLSQMTISDMVRATSVDAHPPLYYIFTIIGQRLFGTVGWMYHIISVIPYVVVLVLSNTVILKKFGYGTAYLLVTLYSVLPNALEFNVEARMYSWASLFVLLSFYYVLKILNDDTLKNHLIFALFSLLAAYTHYYALLSVAFFYVAILIVAIIKKRNIGNVLITYAVTVVAYLPWVSVMFTTLFRTKDGWWLDYIEKISDCLAFFFDVRNVYISVALLLLTIVLVIIHAVKKYNEISAWVIIGLSAAVLTLLVGQGASYLVRPFFLVRYLYPVSGVVWLVLSVMLGEDDSKWKSWIPYIVSATVVVLCVRTDKTIITSSRATNMRCGETVNDLNNRIDGSSSTESSIIISNNSHMNWTILDYYFPDIEHSGSTDNLDKNMCYYLVWEGNLSDEQQNVFAEQGFEADKVFTDGVIGTTRVQIYELKYREDY